MLALSVCWTNFVASQLVTLATWVLPAAVKSLPLVNLFAVAKLSSLAATAVVQNLVACSRSCLARNTVATPCANQPADASLSLLLANLPVAAKSSLLFMSQLAVAKSLLLANQPVAAKFLLASLLAEQRSRVSSRSFSTTSEAAAIAATFRFTSPLADAKHLEWHTLVTPCQLPRLLLLATAVTEPKRTLQIERRVVADTCQQDRDAL